MPLDRFQPVRFLLLSSLVPLLLVPVALTAVARLKNSFIINTRLVTAGGVEVPLPAVSVWALFGIVSALGFFLVVLVPAVFVRRRPWRTRNFVTLAALAVSVVFDFVALASQFGFWD
jgi:hypothetical protein